MFERRSFAKVFHTLILPQLAEPRSGAGRSCQVAILRFRPTTKFTRTRNSQFPHSSGYPSYVKVGSLLRAHRPAHRTNSLPKARPEKDRKYMRRLIAREFPFPGASTVDHVAVLASKLGPLTDTSHLGHAVPEMRSGRCVLRASTCGCRKTHSTLQNRGLDRPRSLIRLAPQQAFGHLWRRHRANAPARPRTSGLYVLQVGRLRRRTRA